MIAGSLVGAILAWLYQRVGVRAIGLEGFEPIANAWTVEFVVATVLLVPLEQYATRESSRGLDPLRDERRSLWAVGGLAVLLGAAAGWFGRDVWFQGSRAFTLILGAMLGVYALYQLAKGTFAGRREFREVGTLLAMEGLLRLVVLSLLVKVTLDPDIVGWSVVAGPLVGFVLLGWMRPPAFRSELPKTPAGRFFGAYIAGSSASQILLASAPLVVGLLGGSPAAVTITFVTFTLFRAPLTLIFSLQGRLLSGLVRRYESGDHGLMWRAGTWLAAIGPVLIGVAWLAGRYLGPWVISVAYDSSVEPSTKLAAWVAAGIVAASLAQILGQLLVARAATGRLAAAWITGLVVACVALFLTSGLAEHRVALAFGIGEAAAFVTVSAIVLKTYALRPVRG